MITDEKCVLETRERLKLSGIPDDMIEIQIKNAIKNCSKPSIITRYVEVPVFIENDSETHIVTNNCDKEKSKIAIADSKVFKR